MEIQIAVAKTNKYDIPESGDTLEVIERPNGGVSVVLADGTTSDREAKFISSQVVHKVIGLIADGVRDGAAARAASDFLYMERNGKSLAYLTILSADFQTRTLVIARNSNVPVFIARGERIECLEDESQAIGLTNNVRPNVSEIPLEKGITIIVFTDGVMNAGKSSGLSIDICTHLGYILEELDPPAQQIADLILADAIRLDENCPKDDMSVVVLRVVKHTKDQIRRLTVRLPVFTLDSL
jgi:serine phosphatase RsbU (regulator of sigma subunit)